MNVYNFSKIRDFFLKKYVLILNDNGLGDYFLVRNYFKYIKQSEKYKNHKIIFLAKPDRIDCLKEFDGKYIDKIIRFNTKLFENNKKHRGKKLKQLLKYNITDIINIGAAYPSEDMPPYSTITLCGEIPAENRIEHVIEPKDPKNLAKYKYDTKLICTPNKDIYEFERNRLFFEQLLQINIPQKNLPQKNLPFIEINQKKKDNLIVIAPFKRKEEFYWKNEYWSELCNKLSNINPDFRFIILGAEADVKNAEKIEKGIKGKVKNLAGRTKSSDLPYIIASAEYLISAETSAVHIASAVGTKTLCISNGSYYKRFQPIPSDKIFYVYPDEFEKEIPLLNGEGMNKYCCCKSPYTLQKILPEKVINKFRQIYKQDKALIL